MPGVFHLIESLLLKAFSLVPISAAGFFFYAFFRKVLIKKHIDLEASVPFFLSWSFKNFRDP